METGRKEGEGGKKMHAQLPTVETQIDIMGGGVGRNRGGGKEDVVDLTAEEEADTMIEDDDGDCVLVVAQSSASSRQRGEGRGERKGGSGKRPRNVFRSNEDDVVEIVETAGGEKRLGGGGAREGGNGGWGRGGNRKMTGGKDGGGGRGGDVFKAVCGRCAYVNVIPLSTAQFEEAPLCTSCGALL